MRTSTDMIRIWLTAIVLLVCLLGSLYVIAFMGYTIRFCSLTADPTACGLMLMALTVGLIRHSVGLR